MLIATSAWAEGCISGNCENGQGTYVWDDGDKYVGAWQNGKRNGQGTFTWVNGSKYVGEYKDSKRNGQGTLTWANGEKYVGEYKDSKRNGQGTFTWANGEKYVGEYKDSKRNGLGTYTWADGDTRTGIWENGEYFGTVNEWNAREAEREARLERERMVREAAKKKYNRIYNACLLDKSSDVDMQVNSLRRAVEETCKAIAEDPSWYEEMKYN